MAEGAAVDAAEAMTGIGAKNDCMVLCLAWPAVGAVAEAGFCDAGLAAEVAWFGAEVLPGSCVRHVALRLPGPLGMARRKRQAVRQCFGPRWFPLLGRRSSKCYAFCLQQTSHAILLSRGLNL